MATILNELDRTQMPAVNEIKKAAIIQVSEARLKNTIPVYYIHAGTQEVVRIEIIFPAGLWQQPAPLMSAAASAMLQEGTAKFSAKDIAEMIDYHGAFFHTEATHDYATLEIHTLTKHLPNVLPSIKELLTHSAFPQTEWDLYLTNKKQSFLVNNKKVSVVGRKKFAELIFGNHHPYGYHTQEQDYTTLKKEEVYRFYKKSYTANQAIILASGHVTEATLKCLDLNFGDLPLADAIVNDAEGARVKEQQTIGTQRVEMKGALQSAIRVGKLLFNRSHPDYCGMQVLNTILGGYFGSRLMANIREDKGYTYGIGSGIVSFSHAGYFNISTEVGVEVTNEALKEIYFEIEKLQNEKVAHSELELVRNYMLGTFLRSMDGPFALADRFKGIYFSGLEYDYYDQYIETVRSITPKQLQDLATKYLQRNEMTELVVGAGNKQQP
jgi:zinc protease